MNKDKLETLLNCLPPFADTAGDPEWETVRRELESDEALKARFERERALDRAIASKLKTAPAPADLRAAILAGRETPARQPFSTTPAGLAIAAMLALLLISWGALTFFDRSSGQPAAAQASAGFLGDLTSFFDRTPDYDYFSRNLTDLRRQVEARGGPDTSDIPSRMSEARGYRCRLFDWEGRRVALICMERLEGNFHLFIVEGDDFVPLDRGNEPRFTQMDNWNFAAWGSSGRTFILGTRGSRGDLENLF